MIKLYVTDVDGTLVKDGESFCNPKYHELVQRLKEQGVLFVAASGRQYTSLKRMFAPVSNQMGFISESGAVLWKEDQSKVLGQIPYELIAEIAEDVQKLPGADLMISGPSHAYVPVAGSRMHQWLMEGYGYDMEVVDNWTFPKEETYVKAAVYHPEIDRIASGWFAEKWNQKLHCVFAGSMWLDCIVPGMNKGEALRRLQEDCGILPEETAVFADNQNDLEMMKCVAYSFAVETARDEVKQAASAIIPNWEKDGVYETICRLAKNDGFQVD